MINKESINVGSRTMRRVAMAGVLAIALGPVVRITPKEHAPVLPKPLKIVSPLGNRSRGK